MNPHPETVFVRYRERSRRPARQPTNTDGGRHDSPRCAARSQTLPEVAAGDLRNQNGAADTPAATKRMDAKKEPIEIR